MSWVLGSCKRDAMSFELLTDSGEVEVVDAHHLVKTGVPIPRHPRRVVIEGNPSSWELVNPIGYLKALGIDVPSGVENRHDVFSFRAGGIAYFVPSLVFMRAMFRPNSALFAQMFRPLHVDELCFVSQSDSGPSVVIEDRKLARQVASTKTSSRMPDFLRWIQLSESSRKSASSVRQRSLEGRISMALPSCRATMAMHGVMENQCYFVTRMSIITVTTNADDTWGGEPLDLIFNGNRDTPEPYVATTSRWHVLSGAGGFATSDDEWERLRPLLSTGYARKISDRMCLDLILEKIGQGRNATWADLRPAQVSRGLLPLQFRRWVTDGRFERVMKMLTESRSARRGPL